MLTTYWANDESVRRALHINKVIDEYDKKVKIHDIMVMTRNYDCRRVKGNGYVVTGICLTLMTSKAVYHTI